MMFEYTHCINKSNLDATCRSVLKEIVWMFTTPYGDHGHPKIEELVDQTALSEEAVLKAIDTLVKEGFLKAIIVAGYVSMEICWPEGWNLARALRENREDATDNGNGPEI